MMDIALGASSWCFHGSLPQDLDAVIAGDAPYAPEHRVPVEKFFSDTVDNLLDSQIKFIEIWYSEVIENEAVVHQLERLAARNMVFSLHAPSSVDLSSMDDASRLDAVGACCSAAQLLSRLGGKTLIVHASHAVLNPEEMTKRHQMSATSIAEIADYCAGLGIRVAVEVLYDPYIAGLPYELLGILAMVDRSNVGFCVDVNHVFPAHRLLDMVHSLGSRIITLHVSDYDGVSEKHWLPGEGIINWADLIFALRQAGYSGPLMYEAWFRSDSISESVSVIERNHRMLMGLTRPGSTQVNK